ncbi:hypothetical protein Vadar_026607 [Vaccinium darrowii]|uniref:Uncharacterized protein n=1 Tax=Vaccinium darrowii TaxID=229202 RepID=A0ACB7XTT5_9ERIC|nr:hypothetical protein Vadar_026607 [Vaccinium darrowii]
MARILSDARLLLYSLCTAAARSGSGVVWVPIDPPPHMTFRGKILRTVDPKLGSEYVVEEVELALKLGLLCSLCEPVFRPSMRQVVQYLERDIPLPELKSMGISAAGLTFAHREGFDDFALPYPSSMDKAFTHSSSVAESLLSGG